MDGSTLTFKTFFSRRRLATTLLALAAIAVLARLGFWQLDRLAQRRAFNARVESQVNQPSLDLNTADPGINLVDMEYRQVTVSGEYDFSNQIAIRNQAWQNQIGIDLVTPLRLSGSQQVILVDRGWVPFADADPSHWGKYDQPGTLIVHGVIRRSQEKPGIGSRSDPIPPPGGEPLKAWFMLNVAGIARQLPYTVLPVYIQQTPVSPDGVWGGGEAVQGLDFNPDGLIPQPMVRQLSAPVPGWPTLDLSEGPNLSYAIQWFAFAAMVAFGYPVYLRREGERNRKKAVGNILKV